MIVLESQIRGHFMGFKDENTIFELFDGSKWQQDESKFVSHSSSMPQVKITQKVGSYILSVDGLSETVRVKKV
jgi:hypothetical protein